MKNTTGLPNEKNVYIAHIRDGEIQTVGQHLEGVSQLAGEYGAKVGLEKCGKLAGLLHDIGKLTDGFQQYISGGEGMTTGKKGPDHSTAGAVWLIGILPENASQMEQMTAQLLALVMMSHHGGLIDVVDELGQSPYLRRLDKLVTDDVWQKQYKTVIERLPEVLEISLLHDLFRQAVQEIGTVVGRLKNKGVFNRHMTGLVCKLLYSILIDSDRTDTAAFMDNLIPPKQANVQELWSVLQARLESKVAQFPKTPEINGLRQQISNHCKEKGDSPSGIYTLNCPTGSGKTFAGLRFALEHSKIHKKQRLFFMVPYLTILEQNVLEIKKILSDGQADLWLEQQILELHSAKEVEELEETQLKEVELISQRMEFPMVFTSMVRFLNTIFASGTRNIRNFHQFANSILIFDEIQTISLKHMGIFNEVLNFLTVICDATVVLSTATQPYLNRDFKKVISSLQMAENPELSGCDMALREKFHRTQFVDDTAMAGDVETVAQFVWGLVETHGDVLVILNTKSAVRQLYDQMHTEENKIPIYLLNTNLYPAHRKEKIEEIKDNLGKTPMIVISTQLIEAGVDISFHSVVRSLAGLDSIVQAAGRCNRHGTFDGGEVHIIKPEFETLQYLPEIKDGRNIMGQILRCHATQVEDERTIAIYFNQLYGAREKDLTYPVKNHQGTTLEIYDLLGQNGFLCWEARSNQGAAFRPMMLQQSFKTAAHYFRAIEEFGTSVVVCHGGAVPLLEQIPSGFGERAKLQRKLQQYTVNLSQFDQKAIGNGLYYQEELGVYILDASYYSETFGVSREQLMLPFCNY